VERIVLNFANLEPGVPNALKIVPAIMVLPVIPSLANAPVRQDGWELFAMKSVQTENMARTVEIFADVKMVELVTMCPELVPVKKDGRVLYAVTPVHLESMDQIVQMLVFARIKEAATQCQEFVNVQLDGRVRSVLIPAHLEHMGRVVKRNVIAIMEPPVIILMGDVTVRQDIPDLCARKNVHMAILEKVASKHASVKTKANVM